MIFFKKQRAALIAENESLKKQIGEKLDAISRLRTEVERLEGRDEYIIELPGEFPARFIKGSWIGINDNGVLLVYDYSSMGTGLIVAVFPPGSIAVRSNNAIPTQTVGRKAGKKK
jgi:hypothetical protein